MATYKVRGTTHNVIYLYRTNAGEKKQQWESYTTRTEAVQRKAYIDYLQASSLHLEIAKAAAEYRQKKAIEKAVSEQFQVLSSSPEPVKNIDEDNTGKTYCEFVEKWLPFHARKKHFSPNSYDSYRNILATHILPYFGEQVMSEISAEDIDDFLDHLSRKPCKGYKSYGKRPREIPTLSSGSIKKCYTVLSAGFRTAKKWHYINEIPDVTAPVEKTVKRRAWEAQRVGEVLETIQDDKILHLAVHLMRLLQLTKWAKI